MPGQFGSKYAYTPKHITNILAKIQDTGRPEKLTITYVQKTWLLSDAQHSAVLDLLRDMGFIDENGIPSDLYAEYQNQPISKKVLAKGVRSAYPELFKAYPNASNLSEETITGYFKQKTGAQKEVLRKIVMTFTTLCGLADFSTENQPPINGEKTTLPQSTQSQQYDSSTLLPITMNIQIVIPSDASSEQYDMIFSSIKKFLTK